MGRRRMVRTGRGVEAGLKKRGRAMAARGGDSGLFSSERAGCRALTSHWALPPWAGSAKIGWLAGLLGVAGARAVGHTLRHS